MSSLPSSSNKGVEEETTEVSVGFIGCGTIAAAIATGLATATTDILKIKSISITERSKSKSSKLKNDFPDLVTVFQKNQDIVNNSDIIFLCVLPEQMSSVVSELQFDNSRHTLVSLVSTSKLDTLKGESGLDKNQVYKMICLPSVATQDGTCLVGPKSDQPTSSLKTMFRMLGGYVECETEEIMNAMMIPGGLMGPIYGILKNNRDWLVSKGVSPKNASYYVGRQYWGMMQDALKNCDDPKRFDDLIEEQTPGGLNEQALENLRQLGMFDAYDTAMEAMLSRLEGKSDGYIDKK